MYYEAGVSKSNSRTGRRRKAKGKLINRYNNLKKLQLLLDKTQKPNKEESENELSDHEVSDDIKNSIDWLQDNEEPWEETLNHWSKTEEYRRSQIGQERQNKISSIYERWPVLKCLRGYNLIIASFASAKFTEDQKCIEHFKGFFTKAIAVKPLPKDDHCKTLLDKLSDRNLNEGTDIMNFFLSYEYVT